MGLGKQDGNGKKGESRTEAILLDRFWVLRRSVDVDGADFLVQTAFDSLEELRRNSRRIQAFGIVQAKFFEGQNQVRIHKSYVLDKTEPRTDFFCLIHTDDSSGQHAHYFFTASDIVSALQETRCGEYYAFKLTGKRAYTNYLNRPGRDILNTIQECMKHTERERNRAFIQDVFATHFGASRHFDETPDFEYHLKELDGVKVVLCRNLKHHESYLLDTRRDLFRNHGTYSWGYEGTGSKFLSACILAHHLDGEPPTADQVEALLKNLIVHLAQHGEHMITTSQLQTALEQGIDRGASLLEKAEYWLPHRPGASRIAFKLLGIDGNTIQIVDHHCWQWVVPDVEETLLSRMKLLFRSGRESTDVLEPAVLLLAYLLLGQDGKPSGITLEMVMYDN
ncbi:DUF6166 domain-containing protein [Pseudomonas sp. NyZ201]|uniref:DUF6166 domain-containing protein n=1 Tax=Pseudomonas sp. NyZ201 TaxID=3409857 RepID=UPI003CF7FA3C